MMSLTRRGFVAASAVASAWELIPARLRAAPESGAVRPFSIHVPEHSLDDLKQRIMATRWPDRETVDDQSQGAQLQPFQALMPPWCTEVACGFAR